MSGLHGGGIDLGSVPLETYRSASERLAYGTSGSQKQFNADVAAAPGMALACQRHHMSPAQIAEAIARDPYAERLRPGLGKPANPDAQPKPDPTKWNFGKANPFDKETP